MNNPFPHCCPPAAHRLLRRQMLRLERPQSLTQGALAIALCQMENVDLSQISQRIGELAQRIRQRVRGDQPQALLAHLHEVLFEEEGFIGATEDYDNPLNSFLPAVLERKKGLPIALSLVYKLVADAVGLHCWGLGLPGYFVVGVQAQGARLVIDPFEGGRALNQREIHEGIVGLLGEQMPWSDQWLAPVSNRYWLTRILQNLLNYYNDQGQYAQVGQMLEMEMILWPSEARLQRDLGLVLARIGMIEPATAWLRNYLQTHPEDPQKNDLQSLLSVLVS